jgi:hypothetical protein
MLVRTPPSEQEKRDAERLYADLRGGHARLPSTGSQMSFWTLERILLLGGIGAGAFLLALFAVVALGTGAVWLYAGLAGTLLVGLGAGRLLKRLVFSPLTRGRDKLGRLLREDSFDWMQTATRMRSGRSYRRFFPHRRAKPGAS